MPGAPSAAGSDLPSRYLDRLSAYLVEAGFTGS